VRGDAKIKSAFTKSSTRSSEDSTPTLLGVKRRARVTGGVSVSGWGWLSALGRFLLVARIRLGTAGGPREEGRREEEEGVEGGLEERGEVVSTGREVLSLPWPARV
jgi:hypothetical protein